VDPETDPIIQVVPPESVTFADASDPGSPVAGDPIPKE
jgi:hypothetical protein